jgi:hypothetical protein
MMYATDSPLDVAPKVLDCIDVNTTGNVDLGSMGNKVMVIAQLGKPCIAGEFVSVDCGVGTGLDVLLDDGDNSLGFGVLGNEGCSPSVALRQTNNYCLTASTTPTLARPLVFMPVLVLAPDIGFVNLDLSEEQVSVLSHELADLSKHTPSGLVSNAQFPLKLFRGNAGSSRGHQEYGVEPRTKGSAGLVQDGSRSGGKLIAAIVTLIDLTTAHPMKLVSLLTGWALDTLRPSLLAYPFKAGVLIGKLFQKVMDGVFGFHCATPIVISYLKYSRYYT